MKKTIPMMIATLAISSEINLSIGSYHIDRTYSLNEVNPGIEYVSDGGIVIGSFKNSYNKNTTYLGYRIQKGIFGASLGIARYEGMHFETYQHLVPLGSVTVDVGRVRVGFIPVLYKHTKGIITFQWRLK